LISAYPEALHSRSRNRFLPLHEAAWGQAPAEIATVICAASPEALTDRGGLPGGQTPHELGLYYQRRGNRFSWPEPEQMLQRAGSLQAVGNWLEQLIALRLPSRPGPQLLWILEELPYGLATLLQGFATPQQQTLTGLPSILEEVVKTRRPNGMGRTGKSLPGNVFLHRCRRPRHLCATAGPRLALQEVEYISEDHAKQRGFYAGMSSARHRHYVSSEVSLVTDGKGMLHRLPVRRVRRLQQAAQHSRHEPKWPSDVQWRRDLTWERLNKSFERGVFLQSDGGVRDPRASFF